MNKENILVYVDGKNVPYFEANIHILSPAVKYGFNVFEGLRGYWNEEKQEVFIFRLWEHLVRLEQSAKIASMELPESLESIEKSLVELIRKNDFKSDLHIRIMLYV